MAATKTHSDAEKKIPPWARGEELRNVEKDVLIPKIVRKISREKCKTYVDDFTNCCKGRTVSMVWSCRQQNREMQDCLRKYFKDESVIEEARIQYLHQREEFQSKYVTSGEKNSFKKKESTTF